jgi:hypothetical protein
LKNLLNIQIQNLGILYEVVDIVLRIYDIFNGKNKRVEHLRGYAATAA